MGDPFIVPLPECSDVRLAGGKAAALAQLMAAGFPVPPGVCVTTAAYEYYAGRLCDGADGWDRILGLPDEERPAALEDCQRRIRTLSLVDLAPQWEALLRLWPSAAEGRWAVRSSAIGEDGQQASFAGLYRSHLGLGWREIEPAVLDLWASIWSESAMRYWQRHRLPRRAPAMAVIIQPTMAARVSGVCYSIHPLTGRSTHVAVNAVPGLAVPLVDGRVTPDHYVMKMVEDGEPLSVLRRTLADKSQRLILTEQGLHSDAIGGTAVRDSSLSDDELYAVARVAKRVERAFGYPVDIEWLYDARHLWLVQARPITAVRPSSTLQDDDCEWTRANFKETLPDLPSPLGLSFLRRFMDAYIVERYRRLGCRIPPGLSAVRVWRGRPYLNGTLFYCLVAQLGGEPSLNQEQMGGVALQSRPAVTRLPWFKLLRAGWLILGEMRRCEREGPAWFAEMKKQAEVYDARRVGQWGLREVHEHLDRMGRWLDQHEATFGIVAGVGQCLQAFHRMLPRWLGPDWRTLLNAALQGQGTIISAQQVVRVAELADTALRDPHARTWFQAEPWDPSNYRLALAKTPFLDALERFLEDFGHRAVGESDVMTPRMEERPEGLLAVIRAHVRGPVAARSGEILARQAHVRANALAEIARRLGRRWDRRLQFDWWYRRLIRFFALREANRHHLMYYSSAVRRLLLRLGELLAAQGVIETQEDIFFLTLEERDALASGGAGRDWKAEIRVRRAERARLAHMPAPDTLREGEDPIGDEEQISGTGSTLRGLPVSGGRVTAAVRVLRSPEQWGRAVPGEIIVTPVIDPGMAPIFAIAGGVIAEMGGTLSHGAIIAREYGLPAVVNVDGAMTRLRDGQRVMMDADTGVITIEPAHHS